MNLEVAGSVEQNVERNSFLRARRRLRLAVGSNTRISVLLIATDRRRRWAAGRAHEIGHVGLRHAIERGARRRIERTFTAAAGKAERGDKDADDGETEKRAVAE
jgi:predicted Zn-dependent protease